ncbi:MAG: SCO family protein [Gemmatimonadetes bacterium]|nr:SCO family protein [Gemmatimonadota bacterium]
MRQLPLIGYLCTSSILRPPDASFPSRSMLHRALQVMTGTLSGFAVVAVLLWSGVLGPGRTEPQAMVAAPFPAYVAPSLVLPQTDGTPFDLSALRGEVALVFFGFLNCPDVCPVTLSTWTQALDRLRPDQGQFQGIFVTVDPARDTPATLGRWLGSFDPSIRGLVGSDAQVARVVKDWGVFVSIRTDSETGAASPTSQTPAMDPHAAHLGTGGDAHPGVYLVDHSARTFLIDRKGRVARILPPNLDTDGLLATLEPFLRH